MFFTNLYRNVYTFIQAQTTIDMYDLDLFIEGQTSYLKINLQSDYTKFLFYEVKFTLSVLK